MGNMIFNKRIQGDEPNSNYRIFPQHMYGGPKGFGDPQYRELSKMELDPMITQRMRDISRADLCTEFRDKLAECGKINGLKLVFECTKERDELCVCIDKWLGNPEFKKGVIQEYLDERSYFRETGNKTKRYSRGGKFISRDPEVHGPALDKDGKYVSQKPKGWNETYPNGPPEWSTRGPTNTEGLS